MGARNILERSTLDTNFYLTHSLLRLGHPHRDVHMPGYVFALTPFVAGLGPGLSAGAALNVLLYLASIVLVYAIARRLLADHGQAAVAAALFAVMPPTPGYLFVVYPEIVVTFAFLAATAWLVRGGGAGSAAVAGFLLGVGTLFRETLLVALPLYLVFIGRRELLRTFLPSFLATMAGVLMIFSRGRAVHPNAIYPSVFEKASSSERPVWTLLEALHRNLDRNITFISEADPLANAEDATLLLLLLLAAAAAAAHQRLRPEVRSFHRATLIALGLLTGAVLLLYVVRVQGGVWGGVRAYMPWVPLLIVLATPLLFRKRRLATILLIGAVLGVGTYVNVRQLHFFKRYKQTDREDQLRNEQYLARYLDRYSPHRIVSRSFIYGLTHFPVEVVWSLPRDYKELRALEEAVGFDFISIHWKSGIRLFLIRNPRYLRINKDERGAEFLIFRRLE